MNSTPRNSQGDIPSLSEHVADLDIQLNDYSSQDSPKQEARPGKQRSRYVFSKRAPPTPTQPQPPSINNDYMPP